MRLMCLSARNTSIPQLDARSDSSRHNTSQSSLHRNGRFVQTMSQTCSGGGTFKTILRILIRLQDDDDDDETTLWNKGLDKPRNGSRFFFTKGKKCSNFLNCDSYRECFMLVVAPVVCIHASVAHFGSRSFCSVSR